MSIDQGLGDLLLEINRSCRTVSGIGASMRVKALGMKCMELALEVKSQGDIEDCIGTLKKILARVQLWSEETSAIQARKNEMGKEVEELHEELDQIITVINSRGENTVSENENPSAVNPTDKGEGAVNQEPEARTPVTPTPGQDDPKVTDSRILLLDVLCMRPFDRLKDECSGFLHCQSVLIGFTALLIALFTLASILSTLEKRKVLEDLEDERAQSIINFLYKVLSEPPDTPMPWLRKHTLLALRRLCGSSMLYPAWYVLKDITDYKSREDGGMFGDISSGKQGSLELCLKVVRLARAELTEVLKLYAKEAIVWGQLRHPNIVPFYGIFYLNEAKEKICLVSPWMKNGNVEVYLKENPDAPRKQLIHDVTLGLEYLHSENIIHGDLKAMNILVDQLGRACIADFGSSTIRVDRTVGFSNATGGASSYTDRWVSPELLQEDARPTRASDVWAFGCVCYEIVSRRLPFHAMRGPNANPRILAAVMRGTQPARRDKEPEGDSRDKVDDESWELMNRCWSQDPNTRPTCREILEELERQGISQRDNEMQDTTIPATIASTNTAKVDLNEVQSILDEIDTAESTFSPVSEIRNILSTNRRLSEILSSALDDPQKAQALQDLRDDRAQLLVDFLPLVSTRSFLSSSCQLDLATRATATLSQLCEALGLYPQRLVLNDITLESKSRPGGLCDIHRGRHGKQPVCVKVFKEVDVESVSQLFVKEAIQWARLDHPNILPFYGIHYLDENPKRFCVVTPWREGSALGEYLERNPSIPRENFVYDIISGLEHLHSEDIVHGRLKMSNVLVDYLGKACITDIGMATIRAASGAVTTSTAESQCWLAPERSDGRSCSKSCDIWAFGCICYEIMTLKDLPQQSTCLESSSLEMAEIDSEIQGLIKSCLARESSGRPTAQEISRRLEVKGFKDHQEEVRRYLLHRDGVRTQKPTGPNLIMTTEKLLRVQYILHKISGDEIKPNYSVGDPLAITVDLLRLLTSVLSIQHKRVALEDLKDSRAQLVLDFVYLAASHPDLQNLNFRGFRQEILHSLSVLSGLYPRSYLLKDIVVDLDVSTDPDGIHKGYYGEQPLRVQVASLGEWEELGFYVETLSHAAALWSQLCHPNVLPFYGVYFPDWGSKQLSLVSPWTANGNIREFLDENPLGPRKPLVYDVAKGLQYLHSQDITHQDLHGETVIVNDIGRACISQFSAAWVGPQIRALAISSLVTAGLNPSWQAPESLGEEYQASQASDIWRFGCVCYEIMTRKDPYYHISSSIEVLRAIIEGGLPIRPGGDDTSEPDRIDDEMWNLMNRCWAHEPGDRPTTDQIVEELESWGLGMHEDDDFQNYVLQEHQLLRHEMRKHPNVDIDFAKVQEILEEVDALQDS